MAGYDDEDDELFDDDEILTDDEDAQELVRTVIKRKAPKQAQTAPAAAEDEEEEGEESGEEEDLESDTSQEEDGEQRRDEDDKKDGEKEDQSDSKEEGEKSDKEDKTKEDSEKPEDKKSTEDSGDKPKEKTQDKTGDKSGDKIGDKAKDKLGDKAGEKLGDGAKNAKDAADKAKDTADAVKDMKNAADTAKNAKQVADTAKAAGDVANAAQTVGTTANAATTTATTAATTATTTATTATATTATTTATGTVGTAGGGGILATLPWSALVIAAIIVIILLIVIVVVAICAISAYITGKTDPENMANNTYVTSEYFYGTRSVYIDDAALQEALQLSYKQYFIDTVELIDEYNVNITINIPLPNINDPFTNATPVDENITNVSLGIGNILANGSSEYVDISFSDLYPKIEYFGFTAEEGTAVQEFIKDYIIDNEIITLSGDGNIDNMISNIWAYSDLQYIFNRCEKVMIKDEIASPEGLTGIQSRRYIASVYMPNKNVVIESSTYTVVNRNEDHITKSKLISKNGTQIDVLKEKESDDYTDIITGFNIGDVSVNTFSSIDSDNISAFSEGLSLFEALNMKAKYLEFFTKNENEIYTWMPTSNSVYYFEFSASGNFIFSDFSLNVKLP